jgi:hypothetical protein
VATLVLEIVVVGVPSAIATASRSTAHEAVISTSALRSRAGQSIQLVAANDDDARRLHLRRRRPPDSLIRPWPP